MLVQEGVTPLRFSGIHCKVVQHEATGNFVNPLLSPGWDVSPRQVHDLGPRQVHDLRYGSSLGPIRMIVSLCRMKRVGTLLTPSPPLVGMLPPLRRLTVTRLHGWLVRDKVEHRFLSMKTTQCLQRPGIEPP